jgi:malonyl-CoA decarboxylase
LRTFATLSPIPGLRTWLDELGETIPAELRATVAVRGWHRDDALAARVREPLIRLAARYLLEAKRGDGAPRDSVARFHVGNGATIDRMCFLADPSEQGMRQSYGVMTSYRYVLDRIADNQVAYALDRRVDASNALRTLSAEAPIEGVVPELTRPQRVVAALRRLGTWGIRLRTKEVRTKEA